MKLNECKVALSIKDYKKVVGIHITENHTGKMESMASLSTSCACNKYCQKYAQDTRKICNKCYAVAQMNRYKNMNPCLEKNTDILNKEILTQFPIINKSFFRFEAFGDIQSETQVINYFNICKANKFTNFAIWTKNPSIINRVIKKGYEKPENLITVISSPYINKKVNISKYGWADKVFTVYDKDTAIKRKININCGSRKCIECLRCYRKDTEKEINELIK